MKWKNHTLSKTLSWLIVLCVMLSLSPLPSATKQDSYAVPLDKEYPGWVAQFGGESGFDSQSETYTLRVLQLVKSEFEKIFGESVVNHTPQLTISYENSEKSPITFRETHEIKLNVESAYWLQFIYQFAHELCHYMLPTDAEIPPTSYRWFSEVLCETMSWYILWEINHTSNSFETLHSMYSNKSADEFHESLEKYLSSVMDKHLNAEMKQGNLSTSSYIEKYADYLASEWENRPVNAIIAYGIFPLFQEHPELWKIAPILHYLDETKSLRENLAALGSLASIPDATMNLLIRELCGSIFGDISPSAYYLDAVNWAVDRGVTNGTSPNTFAPMATCTRGQVATFLWRAKGSPNPKTTANPFTDVDPSSAFYKAILWAAENGVTAGTSDTTFSPSNPCTRAHVVTFLWRAQGKPAPSGSGSLADSFPQGYYTDAVRWADAAGLLDGTGEAFTPSALCPRADIVTYLYRNLA